MSLCDFSVNLCVAKTMYGRIYHIRLEDFELQVERILDSSLRTRAIAIISSHHQNGTVVALSPEARAEGLHRGLKVSVARRMSHSVRLLPYNAALYAKVHRYLYQTVAGYTPLAEPTAFGQYYLDMGGMQNIYRDAVQAGYRISKAIYDRLNLESQIGISTNKLVSRISTAVVPERVYRVAQGNEARFLAPLPSQILPAAGEKQVGRIVKFLFLYQVKNIQDIVAQPEAGSMLFGGHYRQLAREAYGRDNSAVQPPQLQDHIVKQTVLQEDTNDDDLLIAAVRHLAEQLAYALRRRGRIAQSIRLEIHYTDGFKNARKGAVRYNDDKTVIAEAVTLFSRANYRRNRIRSILLDATNFRVVNRQLELFRDRRQDTLSLTLDGIRDRYGFGSICSASSLLIPRNPEDTKTRSNLYNYRQGTKVRNSLMLNSQASSKKERNINIPGILALSC